MVGNLGLLATIFTTSMALLDQTILPVAIPTIQKEMIANESMLQWMINIYFLTLASLILAGGKFSDLLGKRKIFASGTILFALGSLFCAVSPTAISLILSRLLQGIGAALLLPPTIPIIFEAFPKNMRGKIIGISSAASSLFLVLGPYIGGFCTQYLSWRYSGPLN
jgi:MFS family permease